MNSPHELEWIKGELPDVHTVSKNCWALAWFVTHGDKPKYWDSQTKWKDVIGKFRRVIEVHPYENELNPLRWCDSGCFPVGLEEKVVYYAWINKGDH